MKKDELINLLNSLYLDKDEYCIISGGALLMYGIKEYTKGLDLLVTTKQLKKLREMFLDSFNKKRSMYDNEIIYILNDKIKCFIKEKKYIKEQSNKVNGFSCQKLENIIEMKKHLNRKMDIIDIKLIENYIKNY